MSEINSENNPEISEKQNEAHIFFPSTVLWHVCDRLIPMQSDPFRPSAAMSEMTIRGGLTSGRASLVLATVLHAVFARCF